VTHSVQAAVDVVHADKAAGARCPVDESAVVRVASTIIEARIRRRYSIRISLDRRRRLRSLKR